MQIPSFRLLGIWGTSGVAARVSRSSMLITVFTPTYNRAYILPKLFESLKRQPFRDFEWIIVDDGSIVGRNFLSATSIRSIVESMLHGIEGLMRLREPCFSLSIATII